MNLYELVRSFLLWSGIALQAMVIGSVALVFTTLSIPFSRTRRISHFFAPLWARGVVRLAWRCEVDESRIPKTGHFVIAANHQSLADIIVCLHLRHHFKFLSKESVFWVPFLGWFMYPAGYIPIRRGNRHSVAKAMEQSKRWLERGVSVLYYPEGTRSPPGEVRGFKPGAFHLAIETGTPVLPVLLHHTADMLPRDSFYFSHKRDPMVLIAGDPIPVTGLSAADVPALAERTRLAILALKDVQEAREAQEAAAEAATSTRGDRGSAASGGGGTGSGLRAAS